ncbi:MAG: hypothetical protein KME64_16235 [Scytonematopsis contorta HA4267-MV1]|jgi:hypothetical protein|nr:hypothetical protein [Scytonematopsis contorta HA4267-MV1]
MTKHLTKRQVSHQVSRWLEAKTTSAELAIWARKSKSSWENDELELEDEDCILDVLSQLSFADWLDSVPEEYLSSEADCSLSKQQAQKLIQMLDKEECLESII